MNYCRSGRRLTVELDQWLVSCQSPNCPGGQPLPLSLVTELATETIPPLSTHLNQPHPPSPHLTHPLTPNHARQRGERVGNINKLTKPGLIKFKIILCTLNPPVKQPSNQHCRSLPPLPPLSGHQTVVNAGYVMRTSCLLKSALACAGFQNKQKILGRKFEILFASTHAFSSPPPFLWIALRKTKQ